jgi:hypothetical protein
MDDETMPSPPLGRYAPIRSARQRRAVAVLVGLAVLAALALGLWIARGVFSDPVQWQDVGYHVNDDRSMTVTFDVTKAPAATVTCRVHALSQSFGEVGVADVEVGPATDRTQRITVPVTTSELAVTGVVDHCNRPG